MRDHNKLRAFQLADDLAVAVYKHTSSFPEAERFGLTSQLRRARRVGSVEHCRRLCQVIADRLPAVPRHRLWVLL